METNSIIASNKLRAPEAAKYLRVAQSTLAKLRCYGGGPKFAKAGPRLVIYDRTDLDAWLQARACSSTSEYSSLAGAAK